MSDDMKVYIVLRDRMFRELDIDAAKQILGKPDADHETLLAALHKARIQWRDATPTEVLESAKWLREQKYHVPERGPFVD